MAPGVTPSHVDLIGTPFAWGGRGPDTFDCYGLVMTLCTRAGIRVPDYASASVQEQIAESIGSVIPVWTPCKPGPGAIAAIRIGRHISHVAMVLPLGRLIHTWERSGGVCVERLSEWERRIVGYYRYPQ